MKHIKLYSILLLAAATVFITLAADPADPAEEFGPNTSLTEVLLALGDEKPLHYLDASKMTADNIRMGKELVTTGRTIGPDGKKTKLQSKHFKCTHCHNLVQEDPNIAVTDPEARLQYAVKHNIPFLQGTTFKGMVNRESWYNDDYYYKYGDLVSSSRDTLVNSIQLCATVCSQGREFEDWEIDALLAYFYSIEYQLKDMGMEEAHYSKLHAVLNNQRDSEKQDAIKWLKTRYATKSPATFLDPIKGDHRNYGEKGNPEKGQAIYMLSCLHCHTAGEATNFVLDKTKATFKFLNAKLNNSTHFSMYNITRKGTKPLPGYDPYMPHYTKEKMSEQQLEDLIAYIKQQAGN